MLPTIRDEIIGAIPVEQITDQLQQERQERLKRLGQSEATSTEYPSVPPSVADEDGSKSVSSSGYVHASQIAASTTDGTQSPRPKRSKAQLWQDMKINSITRALTLIYTLSLLTLLTRIQLNLLGRRTYLSSVVAMASPAASKTSRIISLENRDDDNYDVYGNDFETNRKFLTFSWWLLHRGSKDIMQRVMAAVNDTFGPVNIREDLTLERLADLIMAVRRKVEGATDKDRVKMEWLSYLLPPRNEEAFVVRQAGNSDIGDSPSPATRLGDDDLINSSSEDIINGSLRRLLDETSDLIDSPTFSQVLTRLLDAAFSHLVDYRIATEAYKHANLVSPKFPVQGMSAYEESRVSEVTDIEKVKLAHVLPIFCKQAHAIAAGSGELDPLAAISSQESAEFANEYLFAIDQVHDLEAFAAVIYSSNFEYEVVEGPNSSASTHPSHSLTSSVQPSRPISMVAPVKHATHFTETQPRDTFSTVVSDGHDDGTLNVPVGDDLSSAAGNLDSGLEAAWQKAFDVEDRKEDHSDAPIPPSND